MTFKKTEKEIIKAIVKYDGKGNTCVLFCRRRNGAENISRS